MPLTILQSKIVKYISINRTPESYLAGAIPLNFNPHSIRFSSDIDIFHDNENAVAKAFEDDRKILLENGLVVETQINQVGFIRANICDSHDSTKIDWAYDSCWRFMPVEYSTSLECYTLHPIDLATNKLLALVGRDEPRDYLDIHYIDSQILSLGALIWASAGKDPGLTPFSILELLKRRGKYHQEDFDRLYLNSKIDLVELKNKWRLMLHEAEKFLHQRDNNEYGALFFSPILNKFVSPTNQRSLKDQGLILHFGQKLGITPRFSL